MDTRHKVSIPIIIAGVLLAVISSVIFFNVGYSKGYAIKSKPVYVYVKYNNSTNKNLSKAFKEAKIEASQHQIETLGKILKAGDKHVR